MDSKGVSSSFLHDFNACKLMNVSLSSPFKAIHTCLGSVHRLPLLLLSAVRTRLNTQFGHLDASQLILGSFAVYAGAHCLYVILSPPTDESHTAFYKRRAFQLMLRLPIIGEKAQAEIAEAKQSIHSGLMKVFKDSTFLTELPNQSMSNEQVLQLLRSYEKLGHVDWQAGRVSGAVYLELTSPQNSHLRLMSEIFQETAYSNPLHADVFPGIRKMESEIVAMCLKLFQSGPNGVGSVTSGGTESLLLACKAYRDYARYERGIRRPVILVPHTAHAGFDKAAQLLNIRIVHVPLKRKTMHVDVQQMRRLINRNVCLLVASAPAYPHGVFDPVQEIAALGQQFNIPVHVDSCLGGFLLPFAADAGFQVPAMDFRVRGVTSISADTHKYGYAPKGTSVLMFSEPKYRHYQYFVVSEWPGGIYATGTVAGSRAGSSIATCWAAMLSVGREGYVRATREILTAARELRIRLKEVPGIFIYGQPRLSVIAVGSDKFNIIHLSDRLGERGWSLNPLQRPPGFHICLTRMHVQPQVLDQLVQDVKELSEEMSRDPHCKPTAGSQAAVYGMAQSVPDISLMNEFANHYLDAYYSVKV